MTPGRTIRSLAELLAVRAAEEPDRPGFIYLADGSREERTLTYGELDRAARLLAGELLARAEPGDRALLYYPAGLDFLIAYFACMHARIVAVPAMSPRESGSNDRSGQALAAIAGDCRPRLVLTTRAVVERLDPELRAGFGDACWLATDEPTGGAADLSLSLPADGELAFLQYTSGSTSTPKGVMISHRNVMANLEAVLQTIRQTPDGVCVTWLPHFHDMGLGGLLGALYGSYLCVFMSPLAFLGRPLRWLRAITRYGGTWSGAPNFAFDLCCKRVRQEDLRQLDLSSWQVVANGSEPVRKDTIDRFTATFGPAGFRPEAMMPSYGLAEAVVFVSGTAERRLPSCVALDPEALGRGAVVRLGDGEPRGRWYVPCGRPAPAHRFRIVDPVTALPCPPGAVGEIWLSGPSVAEGYWGRPEESRRTFRAAVGGDSASRYLRTGDLGFDCDGQIVITGRLKDVIIVAGTNHYPQDIEATVERAHAAVRPGGAVALSVAGAEEEVVAMAEVYPETAGAAAQEIIAAIRTAVSESHQLRLCGIALLQPRSVAKTSSGKIRRHAMRDFWLAGAPGSIAVWRDGAAGQAVPALMPEQSGAVPAAGTRALRALLEERICAHVRRLVDQPDLAVDLSQPADRLGLGSLGLAELKAAIEDEFDLRIPLDRMLDGASLRDVIASVENGAGAAPRPQPAATGHPFETAINPEVGQLLRRLRMDRRYVCGDGSWLTDDAGRRVLDAIANYGAVPFGHNPAEIWRALQEVQARGEPNLVQPSALEAAGLLAERLLAVAPEGLRYAAFANSGAEATEAALKLVRAATGRRRMLSTRGGFHGKTLGALAVTGRPAFHAPFAPPVEDVEFIPYGDLAALERALTERGDSFAGLIVEPLQGEGGIVEPPDLYLADAAELCRRHGVKLIVDEIQTGLGRTGRLFACEEDGVRPDVLLLAKALGGGLLPIGAVLYRADCLTFDFALKHTSTFAGNTLACRAGLATLDLLTRDGGALVRRVAELGAGMKAELERLAARFPQVLKGVRGRGFMLGLELSARRSDFGLQSLLGILAEQERLAAVFASYLLNVEGVRVAPTLISNRVVRIEPPLTFSAEECRQVVAACERAVALLAEGDTAAIVNHLLDSPRPLPAAAPRMAAPAVARQASRRRGDGEWAFIAHPIDVASYQHFDAALAPFSTAEMTELAGAWKGLIEPFAAGSSRIAGHDAAAFGHFVVVPATAEELVAGGSEEALPQIRRAVQLARQQGARIVGLGGYVSILSSGGADLADLGVPLTTGNSFTAVAAADAVEEACARSDRRLDEAAVAVVGAAGSVGRTLSYLMAERAGRLVLLGNPAHGAVSRRQLLRTAEELVAALRQAGLGPSLGPLADRVRAAGGRNGRTDGEIVRELAESGCLVLSVDCEEMLPLCDVVVSATSNWRHFLTSRHFKPGALVCDVSRPRNVAAEVGVERPDILVFEGGLVEVPGRADLGWQFGLPPGTAYACMCEPMILALEKRYAAAPRNLGVSFGYAADLRRWAADHGFRLAELRSFDRALEESDWQRFRLAGARGLAVTAREPALPRVGL